MAWAIERAPNVPAVAALTLVGLANHADRDGSGSYPSVATLARYARKSERAVQRDLRQLEAAGVISLGDQRKVAHLDSRYRPAVYDLAMPRDDADVTPTGSRGDAGGGSRGDAGVTQTVKKKTKY